jgi:diketogulonate reductase-like aldo/keto reductase
MDIPTFTLNDGLEMPQIGLGTYKLNGEAAVTSILSGMSSGYRLLDSAHRYNNEEEVGRAVRECGVPRDELLVTTKLPGNAHGFDEAMMAFDTSARLLGLDVVDLYLIHWPNPSVNRFVDAWQAMIELRDDGRIRSIGVCNFTPEFLYRLRDETGVLPSVNQVELHPYFGQAELRAVHAELGIRTQSWSPIGRAGELLGEAPIVAAAEAHGVTPAQVVLRWHIQLGSIPLPKSGDAQRQRENIDVFGFELSEAEMTAIASLERGRLRAEADPNTHEEF